MILQGLLDEILEKIIIKSIIQRLKANKINTNDLSGAITMTNEIKHMYDSLKICKFNKLFNRRLMYCVYKLFKKILTEENRELKLKYICNICKIDRMETLFLPCRHIYACENCANSIEYCDICSDRVLGTVRIFIQ